MTIGRTRTSILIAGMLVAVFAASSAHALDKRQKCALAIPKAAQKYLVAKLKLEQKCRNAGFKDGSCTSPDPAALAKIDAKFDSAMSKKCELATSNFPMTPTDLRLIGFPGPCSDPNTGDDFTYADLHDCIKNSHDAFLTYVLDVEYDSTLVGQLGSDDYKCQAEFAKQSAGMAACLLKSVSKCRDAILKGKDVSVAGDFCATEPKAAAAIAKCEAKVTSGIGKKCPTLQVTNLKLCTPDQGDAGTAASCLIDAQEVKIDGPEITVPADLIDYEYAARGGLCGDNIVNNLNEECDGPDDSACPGLCGTATTPDGFFACLCKDKPRMVVTEHADADTDNGWTGQSADGDVVEGGGYIVDLYDCDMSGNCNAGPSCTIFPHSPCGVPASAASGTTSNSICAGLGQGTCRKERTATGPHCFQDIQKKCSFTNPTPIDATCNLPGDFCSLTYHGAPVAAAAGGVAVCNVSIFSEDVVGTVNIVTGAGSNKVRQRAITYNPLTQNKPCPVCGGFCSVSKERCDVDGDCAPGMGPCINDAICSDGVRAGKSCRRTAPFGGEITFFGTTSIDCLPNSGLITQSSGGLDINANPRTTGTVSMLPTVPCTGLGFNVNRCNGGSSGGRLCTVASECPGGTCSPQCYCAGQVRPNACDPACVGGGIGVDGTLCADDLDCPGGFCHDGDCRQDLADLDSNQEGVCTSGPSTNFCSITTYRTCGIGAPDDSLCQPPACPFCQMGETCAPKRRACFLNTGIERIGTPGFPDRETGGLYCVPPNEGGINASAGFSGPGALIQREHLLVVP